MTFSVGGRRVGGCRLSLYLCVCVCVSVCVCVCSPSSCGFPPTLYLDPAVRAPTALQHQFASHLQQDVPSWRGRSQPPPYWERLQAMLHQCGPQSWSTLFATRADVTAAQPLIQHCTSRRPLPQEARADKCRPELVLAAQRLCVSAVLPDSGEHKSRLFRMSAHVPVNAVLLFGMRSSTAVAASSLLAGWCSCNVNRAGRHRRCYRMCDALSF